MCEVYAVNRETSDAILVFNRNYRYPMNYSYSRCRDLVKSHLRRIGFVGDIFIVLTLINPY